MESYKFGQWRTLDFTGRYLGSPAEKKPVLFWCWVIFPLSLWHRSSILFQGFCGLRNLMIWNNSWHSLVFWLLVGCTAGNKRRWKRFLLQGDHRMGIPLKEVSALKDGDLHVAFLFQVFTIIVILCSSRNEMYQLQATYGLLSCLFTHCLHLLFI